MQNKYFSNTHVVIMAGGIGSRLWPISTPSLPKQFIDVLGVGRTMIQLTVDRMEQLCPPGNIWVVTGERYKEIVSQQLPFVPEEQILLEPEGRNTAPCIAYACRKIAARYPGADVVVTPSDALVLKVNKYVDVLSKAIGHVHDTSDIVTVGIRPTRPETGYGYICSSSMEEDRVVKVSRFKEKPTHAIAKEYLAAGNYFWNAGIFVWNVDTVNRELGRHAPQIMDVIDKIAPSFYTPGEHEALGKYFPMCEKISIDYAVMEKSENIYVIASDLGWSDLGTWGSIKDQLFHDDDENAVVGGDIRLFDTRNTIVHASDSKRVVVDGLDGYIVSVMDGNVLVCRLSQEQHIKEYAKD